MGMYTVLRISLLITGGLPVPSHLTATELKGHLPEQMIWLGSGDLFGLPVAGLVAMAVVTIGRFILRYTALGRSVYAVGGNRSGEVSGINVDRTKIMVYVLPAFLRRSQVLVLAGVKLVQRVDGRRMIQLDCCGRDRRDQPDRR
jgi:ribose transport system permease protein